MLLLLKIANTALPRVSCVLLGVLHESIDRLLSCSPHHSAPPPPPPSSSFLQAPQDAQIQQQIAQLEQQVNGEHVKMMVTLQQNTCFKKCVTSPSSSLSRGEQECIANCVDRFNESFEFVTSTFLSAQQGGR